MKKQGIISSDAEILAGLSDPRQVNEAIRALYSRHYGTLSSFVRNNRGTDDDAQDIFQEVIISFIRLVEQDKFRGESAIGTFLYALNRNIWLNELKRRGRAVKREERFEVAKARDVEAIDTVIENREAHKMLLDAVADLGESCKNILLLFYYENRSMKDIAAITHYENEQVVRNKKYKCLKKLESLLTGSPELAGKFKSLLYG
jgi:RNA polymerase sigma factor (sigma-70 family)